MNSMIRNGSAAGHITLREILRSSYCAYSEGHSSSVTVLARHIYPSRTKKKEDQKLDRRIMENADSFWSLPPVDLGSLRSDRLNDFLYGEGE